MCAERVEARRMSPSTGSGAHHSANSRITVGCVKQTSTTVRRTYYVLTAGNTLAASLIWGINTIFLLDAGLSNFQAFAANAFFTAGMVLFEIPTGIVADRWGRRVSFLCGHGDACGDHRSLRVALAAAFAVRVVGDRFRAARARVHFFLWCYRGLAR